MYLTQSLHRAVQQHRDGIAVRFGKRQHSFGQYADRVARLAGALQMLGMRKGDRVAILALNSDRYLEVQIAVPWGGGVLSPCDIGWSAAESLCSLDDSGSVILLVDETFRSLDEPSLAHWLEGNTHSIVALFNPERVLDVLERDRVTSVLLVPTMIQMLVDHPAMNKPRDLSALKTIAYHCCPRPASPAAAPVV